MRTKPKENLLFLVSILKPKGCEFKPLLRRTRNYLELWVRVWEAVSTSYLADGEVTDYYS